MSDESFLAVLLALMHGEPADVLTPAQLDGLPALLVRRAAEMARSDPDAALSLNPRFPGYLSRSIGHHEVHVPFPLAPLFPGIAILGEVIALAERMSVDIQSCLCLSGSTAQMGGMQSVGDLDLCEYIQATGSLTARIMAQTGQNGPAALVLVKCETRAFRHPWSGCPDQLALYARRCVPGGAADTNLKLDFCVASPLLGPMPGSNMILWQDPAIPEAGNALRSFAYQEAVIDRGRGVARTLVDASNLAAYCRFLRQQAEELAHSHLIKALKRTLSLCSILDLQPWRDRTLQMLNHEAVQWMTRVKRLQDLTELVQLLPPPRCAPYVIALAAEKDYLDAQHFTPADCSEIEQIIGGAIRGAQGEIARLIAMQSARSRNDA